MRLHKVRIIGGAWRGRKVEFIDTPGIRPTTDRTRETLFNWLTPVIENAICLDLFAGSGVLGLEALSRGASKVVFVDQDKRTTYLIKEHLEKFGSTQGKVVYADAFKWLKKQTGEFDIVFLDPPFHYYEHKPGLLVECFRNLTKHLKPEALIYLEMPARLGKSTLPKEWQSYREKIAGEVKYSLYQSLHNSETLEFSKTDIIVKLVETGEEHFISRSQAKRLLRGLERFKSIMLDFKGVEAVGQGFVDEVFRVFTRQHPHLTIQYCNAIPDVEFMIRRGNPT